MLVLNGVNHVYGNGTRALIDASLTLSPGMFGLLGPNGAGKSTLMRCITGLQIPTSGSIRFDEIDVIAHPEQLRAVLGYLPQDFGVYPRVSAYELLDHLAVLKGVTERGARRDMVEALLAQVNLWEVRKKAVAGYSGGMRQRFGIAQALIGNPRLIIVDEPTAGLDPEERNRFNDLLSDVSANVVVILSTHIVEDVTDLCSTMAVIVNGRIVADGEPHDLMGLLANRVWRSTISKSELDGMRASGIRIISTRLRAGRTEVHVLADSRPGASFEPVAPTLEDVYFSTLNDERHAHHRVAAATATAV
jgi:ABC-type multidrug transport system ATPase subunit